MVRLVGAGEKNLDPLLLASAAYCWMASGLSATDLGPGFEVQVAGRIERVTVVREDEGDAHFNHYPVRRLVPGPR